MSSKKKLIVSLSVAAAVLVAAVIAIVAVFAAANQVATSTINVKFRAKNVDCVIAGAYQKDTDAEATGFGQISFAAAEGTTSRSLAPEDTIVLEDSRTQTKTDVYLDLIYTFKNNSAAGLVITLPTATATGASLSYYVDDADVVTSFAGLTIKGGDASEHTIKIRATLTEATLNSAADVPFAIDLSWTLEAAYTQA